ncbi:hypothetical protein [Alteromonas sp. B31-7]|nr:hypothetical protein [Alteromonas sp. B31-7]QPL49717.1 hypothetical protein IUA53_18125 [Alteromonas sp. B31-7]
MMMREKRKNNNNGNKGPILALVLISALFSTLFVGSNAVADDHYIETKVCEWCDYDDAVALAKQDYLLPDCEWQGNGGSGTFASEASNSCQAAPKDVIVANPSTHRSYKFKVTATNQNNHGDTLQIEAQEQPLSLVEIELLQRLYEIHNDFYALAANTSLSHNTSNVSTLVGAPSAVQASNKGVATSTTTSSLDTCDAHPSNYFKSVAVRESVKREIRHYITQELGNKSWADFREDTDFTGLGFQIGKGSAGISVTWSHSNEKVYATVSYPSQTLGDNKLVFEVTLKGRSVINGESDLNLTTSLRMGSSRMDGLALDQFIVISGTNDLTDSELSECLIENLTEMGSAEVITTGGGSDVGDGIPPDSSYPGTGGLGSSCAVRLTYNICTTPKDEGTYCRDSSILVSC